MVEVVMEALVVAAFSFVLLKGFCIHHYWWRSNGSEQSLQMSLRKQIKEFWGLAPLHFGNKDIDEYRRKKNTKSYAQWWRRKHPSNKHIVLVSVLCYLIWLSAKWCSFIKSPLASPFEKCNKTMLLKDDMLSFDHFWGYSIKLCCNHLRCEAES